MLVKLLSPGLHLELLACLSCMNAVCGDHLSRKTIKRYKYSVLHFLTQFDRIDYFCEKYYREEFLKEIGVSRSCCVPHPMVEADVMNLDISNVSNVSNFKYLRCNSVLTSIRVFS